MPQQTTPSIPNARPTRVLTPRQRQILAAAVQSGYYDYPRRITLTELAAVLGIAKSTLSESLIMIERTVMQGFAHGLEVASEVQPGDTPARV